MSSDVYQKALQVSNSFARCLVMSTKKLQVSNSFQLDTIRHHGMMYACQMVKCQINQSNGNPSLKVPQILPNILLLT